jgi:L-rhamnose mutarotase
VIKIDQTKTYHQGYHEIKGKANLNNVMSSSTARKWWKKHKEILSLIK